ncbi:ribonucleotide reductase subunit alpha [Acidovorax sp. SDU_ACID1]|uniref:ribonucleotide reductase subunit alpha n=1 Tax=Acidovorax sp. SDU_ACID1 TaxID=3136632 RepID=UPI003873BE54
MKREINNFDDLLRIARMRRERQRLLFVFVGTELPAGATPAQRAHFMQGEGGALVPLMCVDKLPSEVASFDALLRESQQFEQPGQPWSLVFTAALTGTPARAPSDEDAERLLRRMVEAVKTGALGAYLPFNREGMPVRLGDRRMAA